jgi:hypothetical protein
LPTFSASRRGRRSPRCTRRGCGCARCWDVRMRT